MWGIPAETFHVSFFMYHSVYIYYFYKNFRKDAEGSCTLILINSLFSIDIEAYSKTLHSITALDGNILFV